MFNLDEEKNNLNYKGLNMCSKPSSFAIFFPLPSLGNSGYLKACKYLKRGLNTSLSYGVPH